MSLYFPKPYKSFGGNISVKVDLSNYTTKTDLKNVAGADTSKLALKSNLANLKAGITKTDVDKTVPDDLTNLKSKVDKSDIRNLETTPVDLSKLCNVVKDDVVKKTEYNAKIKYIEDKIPDITNLAIINAKIKEVKGEIPNINNLATTTALIVFENKVLSVSNLVKKADYNTKIIKIENRAALV